MDRMNAWRAGWLLLGFILTVPPPMLSNQTEVDRNAPESQWLVYSTEQTLIQKGTGPAKEFSSAEECRAEAKRRADYWKMTGLDVVEKEYLLGKCIPRN